MASIPILLLILLYTLVPIAAAVWAIVTLHRLRQDQLAIRAALERLERRLA